MSNVTLSEFENAVTRLEVELKQLETEYTMFFSGRLPKPPWDTRARVDTAVRALDRAKMKNTAARFRFTTVQSRHAKLTDLWERGMRAREEGRPGPFMKAPSPDPGAPERLPSVTERVVQVAALRDPAVGDQTLDALYDSLSRARRDVGAAAVPFEKFAAVVNSQIEKLRDAGHGEVTFRVTIKDEKVHFTARPGKPRAAGGQGSDEERRGGEQGGRA